jgi:hypothetical protein
LRRRRSPQRSRTALNGHWNPVPEVTVGYVFGGLLDQWFRRQFTGPPLCKPKGRNQRIDLVFVTRPAQQQTSMDDFFHINRRYFYISGWFLWDIKGLTWYY